MWSLSTLHVGRMAQRLGKVNIWSLSIVHIDFIVNQEAVIQEVSKDRVHARADLQ